MRAALRVKICGVTTAEEAAAAVVAGADAVGVLVALAYPSEDELPADRAAAVLAALPPFVAGTLVTHAADPERVRALVRQVRPAVVQLHGDFPLEAAAGLRRERPGLAVVKTVHVVGEEALAAARRAAGVADAILLDTRTATRLGGTGLTHDWALSRRIRAGLPATPVVLAGGLTPDNVAEAVAAVEPYGVDVNSGVSVTRGRKSPELMARFVRAARSWP